jgi:hypothetical protein
MQRELLNNNISDKIFFNELDFIYTVYLNVVNKIIFSNQSTKISGILLEELVSIMPKSRK